MSSVNTFPTFHYSQPEEYRFSHDSVFLARKVFEDLGRNGFNLQNIQILDVCSGCGIIGLDFLFHCAQFGKLPLSVDFMEVQQIYEPHFFKNLQSLTEAQPLGATVKTEFLPFNYEILQQPNYTGKYDLILSNPPYFQVHQGTLSPSDFKNRCRFFIDSNLPALLAGVENSLVSGGRAYVLLRSMRDHGEEIFDQVRSYLSECSLECRLQIRGTDVALIIKNSPS